MLINRNLETDYPDNVKRKVQEIAKDVAGGIGAYSES